MPIPLRSLVVAFIALLLTLAQAAAQEAPPALPPLPPFQEDPFTAFSFFAENDVLQPPGRDEDRNYTGAFAFQFSGGFIPKWHLDAPLNGIDHLTKFEKAYESFREPRRYSTLLVFGSAFTPDELRDPQPIRNDRPYASVLGVSVRHLMVNNADQNRAFSSELVVGVLGLPVARNLQTWIHRRLRAQSGHPYPYDPQGWHNQISDGGELTALYRVGYERFLAGGAIGERKHFQVSGGYEASVGYYTYANLAANARLGWFTTDFWQFNPGAVAANGGQVLSGGGPAKWDLFLFANARPKLVLYNALLQGQFRDSVHTLDPKHGLVEWDLGVSAYVRPLHLQVTWNALAGRTPEFKGGNRTHTWGSLIFTYVVNP